MLLFSTIDRGTFQEIIIIGDAGDSEEINQEMSERIYNLHKGNWFAQLLQRATLINGIMTGRYKREKN